MRFIADGMLGTLAKWLRILGYDTLYDPDLDDHQLVRIARAEGRLLLTRDRELARRRGVRVLLVASEGLDDQIREVLARCEADRGQPWPALERTERSRVTSRAFSRCPSCNEPLEELDRERARGRLPAYVVQAHETFKVCPGCRRVYWRGTHWQRMQAHLSRLGPADGAPSGGAPDANSP